LEQFFLQLFIGQFKKGITQKLPEPQPHTVPEIVVIVLFREKDKFISYEK